MLDCNTNYYHPHPCAGLLSPGVRFTPGLWKIENIAKYLVNWDTSLVLFEVLPLVIALTAVGNN